MTPADPARPVGEGAEDIAAQAIGVLDKIVSIYSAVWSGDLSSTDGWGEIERALRGPPPEGELVAPRLAAALASLSPPADPPDLELGDDGLDPERIRAALAGECPHADDPRPEFCKWCDALAALDRIAAARPPADPGLSEDERDRLYNWITEAELALTSATVIGQREAAALHYANHDRLVALARDMVRIVRPDVADALDRLAPPPASGGGQ